MTTFTLVRHSLNNVDDVAGRWQHEGGEVFQKDKKVGYYASTKRVTFGGTDAQNTAMLTLTIFLGKSKIGAPENITLQGSHDFNTGSETGSVSAASATQSSLRGKTFNRIVNTVNIG
ncbi:MAG: hypothetical protein QM726_17055 [Chitinophagaceae bacterium]